MGSTIKQQGWVAKNSAQLGYIQFNLPKSHSCQMASGTVSITPADNAPS